MLLLSAAALMLASCDKKEGIYVPAEKESGTQYFFSVSAPLSYPVKDETVTSVKIPVLRSAADAASQVVISVKDTSGLFFPAKTASVNVAFEIGEKESSIEVPVSFAVLSQTYNKPYGVVFTITENGSEYALVSLNAEIYAPEPWTLLGEGKYSDAFTYPEAFVKAQEGGYIHVNIYQNDLNKKRFKIEGAYRGYCEAYDSAPNVGITDSYDIYLLDVGDQPNPNGAVIAKEGLVKWDMFSTEAYDVGQDIYPLYPGSFNSLATNANYEKSKVDAYQENGLPGQITLDPYWYVLTTTGSTVGGWGFAGKIVIVFPGYDPKEYTVEAEYQGLLSVKDGNYAIIDVELGKDVEKALLAIVPGDDPQAALNMILAEDESVMEITKSGEVQVPIPEELAEAYSYVIVSVAEDEMQELAYETFAYKDFSIKLVADKPELSTDMKSGSVKATVTMGKDVEYGEIALFEGVPEEKDPAVFGTDAVKKVHYSGEEFTFDLPKTGKYTILAVSYAEEKDWNISSASFDLVGLTFVLDEDFEAEDTQLPEGWTSLDADGDKMEWFKVYDSGNIAHSGKGSVISFSWYSSALYPNDWLFSPAVNFTKDNYLSFWVSADDPSYYAEHYAVYLLTSPEASDSAEPLMEDTLWLTSESGYQYFADYEEWQNTSGKTGYYMRFVIPIPADFADKTGYIAFRHFNCSDYYTIDIDDVQVSEGNPVPEEEGKAPVLKKSARNPWMIPVFDTKTRDNAPAQKSNMVSVARGSMASYFKAQAPKNL